MKKKLPEKLYLEEYFACPIWYADAPEYVDELNKASDPFIVSSKESMKHIEKKRTKEMGDKGDLGLVYHSTSLINQKGFIEFQNYVGATCTNLLNEMGFDLTNYEVFITEMWVQEFAKDGGGHHALHTHWNGHMSGFYFLKGSKKTSAPLFEDPRSGNMMNLLPEKDKNKVSYASSRVHYIPNPGRMIFFPSYMPHQYTVDIGYEPFRFIHWNAQAIPKSVLDAAKNNR
jgi:uncharacterized protein (TIGR02466 family)